MYAKELTDFAVLHFNYRFAIWAKTLISLNSAVYMLHHASCIIPIIPVRANVIGEHYHPDYIRKFSLYARYVVCLLNDDMANATVALVIHGAVYVGTYPTPSCHPLLTNPKQAHTF